MTLLSSWHLSFCQPRACCRAHNYRQKYGWDEEISDSDSSLWQGWPKELACLRTIAVLRFFKPPGFGAINVHVQLHHFSDASEYGYGAASYLRIAYGKGVTHCSFVLRKSRVTPLKWYRFFHYPRVPPLTKEPAHLSVYDLVTQTSIDLNITPSPNKLGEQPNCKQN